MKKSHKLLPLLACLHIALLLFVFQSPHARATTGAVKLVADLNKTQLESSSYPSDFIELNGKLYFTADDGIHGRKLWVYDDVHSPQKVEISIPGVKNLFILYLTIYNDKLYFTARISNNNYLFEYDGVNQCVQIGEDENLKVNDLIVFDSALYILDDRILYRYFDNGTLERVMEGSAILSSITSNLAVYDSQLYFAAFETWETNTIIKLWSMDKDQRIHLIADNNEKGFKRIGELAVHNRDEADEKLILGTTDDSGKETIWYYTATSSPELVKIADGKINSSGNSPITKSFNNAFYYSTYISDNDYYGTPGNYLFEYNFLRRPRKIELANGSHIHNPGALTVLDDKLYFSANTNSGSQRYLFEYEGFNYPTLPLQPHIDHCSNPGWLYAYNSKLYYAGFDPEMKTELCQYDLVSAPKMVADINYINQGTDIDELTVVGNKLFFTTQYDPHTRDDQLWYYDGKKAPQRIKENYLAKGAFLGELTLFQEKLFFLRYHSFSRESGELWSLNTNGKLTQIKIIQQHGISYINHLFAHRGKLYFLSQPPDYSPGTVYEYDGKSSIKAILQFDNATSDFIRYVSIGDTLYFSKHTRYNEDNLWEYSGQGTAQLVTGIPGEVDLRYGLAEYASKLFFIVSGRFQRKSLFSYDGNKLVVYLKNFDLSLADFSDDLQMVTLGDKLLFPYKNSHGNYGLFSFAENQNIYPVVTKNKDDLTRLSKTVKIGSNLYFYANNSRVGVEPFVYNMEKGLYNLADISSLNSEDYQKQLAKFTGFRGKVYFTADDGITGNELYEFTPANGENLMGTLKLLLLND